MLRRNSTSDNYNPGLPSFNYEIKDPKKKQEAVQYSLHLIQDSMDQLQQIDKDEVSEPANIKPLVFEKDCRISCSNEMIKELIKDHERLIEQLSTKLGSRYERLKDSRFASAIRHIIEEHRTVAWTLKRFLVG
jgi:hypothetical protein